MIKNVMKRVWAFDIEWVPDPVAGRVLYDIPDDVTDPADVMRRMWEEGGATEEDSTPFLKTAIRPGARPNSSTYRCLSFSETTMTLSQVSMITFSRARSTARLPGRYLSPRSS